MTYDELKQLYPHVTTWEARRSRRGNLVVRGEGLQDLGRESDRSYGLARTHYVYAVFSSRSGEVLAHTYETDEYDY